MAFRIRQGLESARAAVIPALGEPLWTTDTNRLYIGDGSTPGGVAVSSEVDLTEEGLQDVVGAMFVGNSTSGITFTYNDTTGKINATVNFPPSTGGSDYHFNVTGIDSTLTQINRSETIQFVGLNGIAVGVSETPGGVTRVNIDGSAVQGTGGGGADLTQVGWFLTGVDSTQSKINNSETVQVIGTNGINVTVDDTGSPCVLTIDAANVGSVANTTTVFSVPYYNAIGNDLVSAGPDMRFSSEQSCLSANVFGANTYISQVVSTPLNIVTILADVPTSGQITVTYNTHPHPPFYVGRNVKLENCNPSVWNGVYEVISSTTTSTVLRASYSGILLIPNPAVPTVGRIINIGTLNNTTQYLQPSQPLLIAAGSVGAFGSNTSVTAIETGATIFVTGSTAHTAGNINFNPAWSGFAAYINNGTIRETTQRGMNVFTTGENKFVQIGGTIDLNNNTGPVEYPGKLRVLDNTTFFGDGQIAIVDIVQVHNNPLANSVNLSRTRGTYSAPLAVQAGDALGAITFQGFDGISAKDVVGYSMPVSASIFARAAETPAYGQLSLAGELVFQTAKLGAGYVLSDALLIDRNQNATFYSNVNVSQNLNIGSQIRISGNVIETVDSNANLDLRANGTGFVNLDNDVNITGTLLVSNVSTSDSSPISVNTAIIFNSDATIENNLIVNNNVYATEFVSTSAAPPEISATSNFSINVNGNIWEYATNGDLTLPDDSTIGNSLWTAATSGYVGLNANNGDNSVSVGDTSVIVTTNANTLSYNFYFNTDGGLKLPIRSSAPPSPVSGSIYVADGTAWDPDSKGGSYPYPVYYDGNAYNALY